MPDIHELLDETKKHCDSLVEQIEALKQSKDLNNAATTSLESVCKALKKTSESIKPFTQNNFKRTMILLISSSALNSILALIILAILMIK